MTSSGRDPTEYNQAIGSYLRFAGFPTEALDYKRHYAHLEPFQPLDTPQRSFHIILDLEKDSLDNPDFGTLKHEVYRVRRDNDGIL
jgi:hypothetical protein